MSEHLHRAQSARPLLDVPQQLVNITSLSNVVNSHKWRLQRVVENGLKLLLLCRHEVPPHPCPWQNNVEAELQHLDATWRQLERVVRQQKERLECLSVTDPERQLRDHLVLFSVCLKIIFR